MLKQHGRERQSKKSRKLSKKRFRKKSGKRISKSNRKKRTSEQTSGKIPKKLPIRLASIDFSFILKRNKHELSVIICASNEEDTIGPLIQNVRKLNPKEIIVIVNGSTDSTLQKCQQSDVQCYSFPELLGHDVGRAVGASKATGSVLLFLDGDMVLKAEEMFPFVARCYGDTDIVLNNVNPYYTNASMVDSVSLAKAFLNKVLRIPHLNYSSLTAVPHAMKKSAVDIIGIANLCVPPKAMAIAVLQGLSIDQVIGVNVIKKNKRRVYNSQKNNAVEKMILGDHIEAFQYIQSRLGERAYFPDHVRSRETIRG